MTEAEWLACNRPQQMLEFLPDNSSERKLRLFAVACCRRVWHLLSDERSRRAVEAAERFADDHCGPEELDIAWRNSWQASPPENRYVNHHAARAASAASTWYDPDDIYSYLPQGVTPAEQVEKAMRAAEQRAQQVASLAAARIALASSLAAAAARAEPPNRVKLVRCIFGNPFRPVTFAPAWRTATVTSLAQAIYDDRAFDRTPILADALEDAGCTSADVLNHCRGKGEHVRGCWVVDLVLGKE
ncbi:hypothetical protein AYO44_13375 [Planctomycetaceae bacterium SCGC AG-212-F19]|nr:hypothetical protein AYO44_13375 [Planctomycetaceae bacterium SCGC AG-212-F19]